VSLRDGQRALVTGAAGFVGRWLIDALRRDGIAVTALATEPSAGNVGGAGEDAEGALPPIEWRYGDLRDGAYVRDAAHAAPFDYVVHLAAISHLPTAEADPGQAWDVNVTATARLLHALTEARRAGAADPTVLIVGSAEQYGRHDETSGPLTESAAQLPRTVYAATKAAQEVLALQQWRATGLRVVVARSFNHSGRGQEPRFVIPALVSRALALRTAPTGTPLVLGNLAPVRDFLHVSDVVAAYISLCRRGAPGEAYNVASGIGRSVREIVELVLARTGVQAELEVDPALVRPVDVPALVGDSHKLQHATGWRATRSFEDIIDDLIHASTH
jgi:GDP-4-dehydro-6-deoxy-D-mannose reductase